MAVSLNTEYQAKIERLRRNYRRERVLMDAEFVTAFFLLALSIALAVNSYGLLSTICFLFACAPGFHFTHLRGKAHLRVAAETRKYSYKNPSCKSLL
jgi:hypothetical protein